MAETASTMLPLGTKAPNFCLLDVSTNKQVTLTDVKSDIATVIMFLCNHCPYVKLLQTDIVKTALAYQPKGIRFIAISANDAESYPKDGPEAMRIEAEKHHYPFPYLYDETQEIAKAYDAACTPDFYIFDGNLACVYRGRYDAATPGNGKPVTGADLHAALDAILAHTPVSNHQIPSLGCNIKWRRTKT